ncbi:uncharacterized protein KQ657_004267 [Scheffersomyces spartinae]|uniref:Vacuolar protein sorting-associated protein 54 C-terminal domain-containing protein n=1 Tax=Scheffersomyces spartinae TaxID=45513 RepID=A0A9P7VAR0_9ASCO|nr:uncharacterized protein KQ657_004267 [Scheffersomyces spartinae]KAG7194591.1 hypothetical protein KQ657_004267 [Scheffersomyces spartinae]
MSVDQSDNHQSTTNGQQMLPTDISPSFDTESVNGNISLNDDLTIMSETSYSNGLHVPRSGSVVSRRTSTETESVFLSLGFFQSLYGGNEALNNNRKEEFSPLGPNSIFELTYASDQARQRHNKPPRVSVTINGGQTVVNNLRVPTTKDIPPILLLKLKHKVSSASLESLYDAKMFDAYKSFELSYNSLTEVSLQKLSQDNTTNTTNNGSRIDSTTSSTSNFDTYILDSNDNNQVKTTTMGIPDVYFDSDFRLDNSRVFKKVIENAKILPDENLASHDEYLVNNTNLQEKISQYLDIVEVELIQEISKSSESFFGTFESIEGMRTKSETCKSKFESIMTKLHKLKSEQAERGMKIVENLQKKKDVERLESALLQIKYVQSYFHLAQRSFGESKYSDCLKQVIMVEHLLNGIEKADCQDVDILELYPKLPYPMQTLLHLPAFIHLRNDLEMLKKECSINYINDFIHLLVEDLRQHCASVSSQETINRIYLSINKSKKLDRPINLTYQTISSSSKELLAGYIKNLIKSGYLVPAYDSYQDRIVTEIKSIIKTYLPSNRMESEGSQSSSRQSPAPVELSGSNNNQGSLSLSIKALTPREFECMLQTTYAQLSECLRRLTSHQKVLLDLSLSNIPSSSTIDFMSLDISNAIGKAIEICQIRLTKIINVRLEQNADLPLLMYLKLYALTSAFLQECEQISPMTMANSQGSLGEWFKNHMVYFVHKHHLNSMKLMINYTDKETWREVTSPEQIAKTQGQIQEIIGYSQYIESENKSTGFDGSEWLKTLDLYEDNDNKSDETVSTSKLEASTKVTINDEIFVVPMLIPLNMNLLREYVMISKVFHQYSSQIVTQLLNFFKLLNSKVSQAILNAGATRTAGLKHITTKHIAICIQAIEFYILVIPLFETIFRNVPITPASNPNAEPLTFPLVLSNYKDHENELFSKLVSIMHDRIVSHCNSIVSIDWSVPLKPATHSKTNKYAQQCHPYMETLVNETNTVTRVLMKYLPEIKHTLILLQIFDDYRKMLVECYCTKLPQFKNFDEKQAVLKDIDYFRVNLCEVPGYGNSGQIIWENVNALSTIEDEEMDRKMRANFENEAKAPDTKEDSNSTDTGNDLKDKEPEPVTESKPEPEKADAVVTEKAKEPEPAVTESDGLVTETDSLNANEAVTAPESVKADTVGTEAEPEKVDVNLEDDKEELQGISEQIHSDKKLDQTEDEPKEEVLGSIVEEVAVEEPLDGLGTKVGEPAGELVVDSNTKDEIQDASTAEQEAIDTEAEVEEEADDNTERTHDDISTEESNVQ